MQSIKNVVVAPWLQDAINSGSLGSKDKLNTTADAYARVPIIYRAIRYRCNTLVSVPHQVVEGEKEVSYPFEDKFPISDLIWKCEASLLLSGAAYVLRQQDEFQSDLGLRVLNPFTVKMDMQNGELIFWQETDAGRFPRSGYWTKDEVIYLRDYSPIDDIGPGVSPCSVAMGGASLQHYLTLFASQFFEHGAMPVTMVTLPPGVQKEERERVEGFFKRAISGLKNFGRVIGVSGETKITTLTPQIETLAIPELDSRAVDAIAWAFDIPVSLLKGSTANFAEKDADTKSFISDTISPRTKFFEGGFKSFLSEYGQELEFDIQSLPVMQEDEASRSGALKNLTDAGVPLRAALLMLGYDLSDEIVLELDRGDKPVETAQPVQQPMDDTMKSSPVEVHLHTNNDVHVPDMKIEPQITIPTTDVIVGEIKQSQSEIANFIISKLESRPKEIVLRRDDRGKLIGAEVKEKNA